MHLALDLLPVTNFSIIKNNWLEIVFSSYKTLAHDWLECVFTALRGHC